jgi:hypothetical protein
MTSVRKRARYCCRGPTIAFTVGFVGWLACFLLPFAVVGESWGMLWIVVHCTLDAPLSDALNWGREPLIVVVTFAYAIAFGGVLAFLTVVGRKAAAGIQRAGSVDET